MSITNEERMQYKVNGLRTLLKASQIFVGEHTIDTIMNKMAAYQLPLSLGGIIIACDILNRQSDICKLTAKNIDKLVKLNSL